MPPPSLLQAADVVRVEARRELQVLVRYLDAVAAADRAACQSGEDGGRRLAGLGPALRITALLLHHRCGWADMLTDEPALAKLCGRLGSEFRAEQEAAYVHALRHLARHGQRWSALMRVPAALCGVLQTPPEAFPEPRAATRTDTPVQPSHPPPEGDWAMTIDWLIIQRAWRGERERARLHALAAQTIVGGTPDDADAVWLRELWWQAELLTTVPPVAE